MAEKVKARLKDSGEEEEEKAIKRPASGQKKEKKNKKRSRLGTLNERSTNCVCLCVEDNRLIQRLVSQWLESCKIRHFHCYDGVKAVEMCKSQKFDIILMDVCMPLMDGIQATNKIRNDDDGLNRNTAIIALSGLTYIDSVYDTGVNGFIKKPFPPDKFLEVINTWARVHVTKAHYLRRRSPSISDVQQLLTDVTDDALENETKEETTKLREEVSTVSEARLLNAPTNFVTSSQSSIATPPISYIPLQQSNSASHPSSPGSSPRSASRQSSQPQAPLSSAQDNDANNINNKGKAISSYASKSTEPVSQQQQHSSNHYSNSSTPTYGNHTSNASSSTTHENNYYQDPYYDSRGPPPSSSSDHPPSIAYRNTDQLQQQIEGIPLMSSRSSSSQPPPHPNSHSRSYDNNNNNFIINPHSPPAHASSRHQTPRDYHSGYSSSSGYEKTNPTASSSNESQAETSNRKDRLVTAEEKSLFAFVDGPTKTILEDFCHSGGIKVYFCDSLRDLLTRCSQLPTLLIFIDIYLCSHENLEPLRLLRMSWNPNQFTPVIGVVANAEHFLHPSFGMQDVLTAPVHVELLGQAINRWINFLDHLKFLSLQVDSSVAAIYESLGHTQNPSYMFTGNNPQVAAPSTSAVEYLADKGGKFEALPDTTRVTESSNGSVASSSSSSVKPKGKVAAKKKKTGAKENWLETDFLTSQNQKRENTEVDKAEKERQSRMSHNEKERIRRRDISSAIDEFRDIVPGCSEKTDKARVLKKAVEYMRFLVERFETDGPQ